MKIDKNNKTLEFACKVCLMKAREKHPNMVGCAFRCFDNEYCPHIEKALEEAHNVAER